MITFRNLMLIDDDEDDRYIFLSVLRNITPSIACSTATNGHDALVKLKESDSLPQVIFLDLNMPLMDGKQFLTEIKKYEFLKNIPVVILTTSSDKETIIETKSLGAVDFITKPYRYADWESTLKTYLTKAP